jgi:phosphoribosylformylglycinamidine (FGAM) synthase-like enzyme
MHRMGWVKACHDTGQGGLLTAVAEMAVGSGRGCGPGITIDLDVFSSTGLAPEKLLFSETGGFVVEAEPGSERELLAMCARNRVKLYRLGVISGHSNLEVVSGGKRLAAWKLDDLREAYESGCRSIFGIGKESK